ncbi:putative ribonuclease H-like domain-containing protein [Tanacetum coccineum]|uniref:Ribonuclease H-like domain-containing protein n=1 Tax=Tanacetum coccineum TaxID=301880 RepID=A0ABQ5HHJ2_9ASTR
MWTGMRVQTINGKKYILVIVDDYSRFTWVKFLRSKDETPAVVLKFLVQIQVGLNKIVRFIRTDNGTEFVNKTLYDHYDKVGIFHQKTVPRTPQQNGVVERRNRTLVEAARTMLIFSKAPMFLWARKLMLMLVTPKNRSLIHTPSRQTPSRLARSAQLRSLISHFSESLVLFVTLQMTVRILENYNSADIRIFVADHEHLIMCSPATLNLKLQTSEGNPPYCIQSIPLNLIEPCRQWMTLYPIDKHHWEPQDGTTMKTRLYGCFVVLYNSVLSKVRPKKLSNLAATVDCCFQARQDEIHEF